MPDINVCPKCGIPLFISSQHVWLDNGVIQPKEQEDQRLVFFECGNLDPLFDGISEIIGMSIEHLVIDASRRSTRSYMDHVVPDDIKEMIRAGERSRAPTEFATRKKAADGWRLLLTRFQPACMNADTMIRIIAIEAMLSWSALRSCQPKYRGALCFGRSSRVR